MNLEQLTKTQTVLLALLVSFMTSIATGIVTVTLVEQAPPAVTQTINRVVERTVERVVPSEGEDNGQEEIIREVQVVVKENDLVPSAVAKTEQSIVRVYTFLESAEGVVTKGTFLGIGFFVSSDGLVVTDSVLIAPSTNYVVEVPGGGIYRARLKNGDTTRPTALIGILKSEGDETIFTTATLANLSTVQLGQTVLTLSGKERNKVLIGITSDIVFEKGGEFDAGKIDLLSTDITDSSVLFGAPLIDLFGAVIGIYTASSGNGIEASYTPISIVEEQLKDVLN